MLETITTKAFEKDLKRSKKRGRDLKKLKEIMEKLLKKESLPIKNRDHWLSGNHDTHRECHIEPDWLLIYKPEKDAIIFLRLGTHSDLFK